MCCLLLLTLSVQCAQAYLAAQRDAVAKFFDDAVKSVSNNCLEGDLTCIPQIISLAAPHSCSVVFNDGGL